MGVTVFKMRWMNRLYNKIGALPEEGLNPEEGNDQTGRVEMHGSSYFGRGGRKRIGTSKGGSVGPTRPTQKVNRKIISDFRIRVPGAMDD